MRHTGASVWKLGVLKQEKEPESQGISGSYHSARQSRARTRKCGVSGENARRGRSFSVGVTLPSKVLLRCAHRGCRKRGVNVDLRGVKEKVKFPLWIRPDIMEQVRAAYAEDDCRSQSEYIEKAIKFYLAYKTTEQKDSFLPSVFLSEIRGILSESDHRHASMLFKLSVEMAMLMNIVAATQEIDKLTLERLRGECVKEVKRLNGTFSMEDAVNWQSS